MPSPPLVAVVLAAGASTRMGSPKPLLELDGRPLILHHIAALRSVSPVVRVVLGARAAQVRAVLPAGVEVVENRAWACTGMADSLRLAVADLDPTTRVLVTPVDVPPAPAALLEGLLTPGGAVVPRVQGQDAHPVVIEAGMASPAADGGTLRQALAAAPRLDVDWTDGLCNLNTPGQWQAWLKQRDTRA